MTLRIETTLGVRTLTLARPERGNALDSLLVDALIDAVRDANADAGLHTLVLRGAGAHFCTGLDLSELERQSDGDLLLRLVRIEQLLAAVWHSPLRTVALATGRTWGAGADLFATCERRAVVPGATLRFPGAAFGIVLGTRRLADRIGVDRARRCTTETLTLDAEAAHRDGLATEVVPADLSETWLEAACLRSEIDRDTQALLRSATRPDHRAADLAELVGSAARPGLQQRIASYRARQTSAVKRNA